MLQKLKIIILIPLLVFNFTLMNEVMGCCSGGSDIMLTNTSISSAVNNGLLPPNVLFGEASCIFVSGTLNIDQNYEFWNTEFRLDQGAEIIVSSNVSLTIESSNLEGCTYLWNGITVQEDATLNIGRRSSISDAIDAIRPMLNSSFYLTGVTFDNNIFGVRMQDIPQIKDHSIVDCSFLRTATILKFKDVNDTAEHKSWGIQLKGTSSLNIGYPSINNLGSSSPVNIFDNLFIGIFADAANISVHGCQFTNILDHAILFGGDGHFIQSGLGAAPTNSGNPGPLNITPSFENVKVAISAINTIWTESDHNFMIDCIHGYDVLAKPISFFSITRNNIINSFNSAINIRSFTSAGLATIENNYIESTDNQDTEFSHGINFRLPLPFFVQNSIQDNEIRIFDRGASAILIANHGPNVFNNLIGMRSNQTDLSPIGSGIDIEGVGSVGTAIINNNTVEALNINANIVGIRNRSASSLNINCNFMDNINVGARFEGVCTNTNFRGNSFNNHDIGLHLDNSIMGFGSQEHKGNTWTGSYTSNGARYDGDIFNLQEYRFIVNPSNFNLTPPNPFPALNWFDPEFGETYNCPDISNPGGGIIGIDLLTPLDIKIAKDNLTSLIYNEEQRWLAKKRLFRKIVDQNLVGIDSEIDAFYTDHMNSNIAQLVNIERAIELALIPNEIDNEQLNINREQITSLMNSISDITKELVDITGEEQTLLIEERQSYSNQIHVLNSVKKDLIASIETHRNNLIDQVIPLNNLISPENVQENNYKVLNEINLNYLFKGDTNLDDLQTSAIYNIANQCPYQGGEAVFKARLMYNELIDSPIYFDDDSLCSLWEDKTAETKSKNKMEEINNKFQSSANLYPNPANKVVNLTIQQSSFQVGEIVIFDMLGKKVFDFTLSPSQQKYTFDTSNFDNGVYFYQVWIDGKSILSDKLNIIRN